MEKRESDRRVAVFERTADKMEFSGHRRLVAKLYFLGVPVKEVPRAAKVPEGTMKRDLAWLHGRLDTSNRAEFVHRVYEHGGLDGRSRS